MAPDQKVQIFSLGTPKRGTPKDKRRYRAKWAVDGRHKTRAFKTKAQAERLRSNLLQAARDGLRFDVDSGEPVRWQTSTATWWSWSTEWLGMKWSGWSGNSRKSTVETLTAVTPFLVRRGAPDAPETMSRWLSHIGFVPKIKPSSCPELVWLERWSIPLNEITPGVLEKAIISATTKLDGQQIAAVSAKRRYNGIKSVFRAAVARELIEANPTDRMIWSPPRDSTAVNISVLPSMADIIDIVESVAAKDAYAHYAAFFASVGFAGLRPSEAARLRVTDLSLPSVGWGSAHLPGALTSPGARFTVDGQSTEEKELKQRPVGETRTVPLPPILVRRLVWHIEVQSKNAGDRLFTNALGNDLSKDNWGKPWREERSRRWPPGHKLSTVTTYDLRHSAATMMLQAGASAPEVARRLGHSVDMLLKIYAGVFDDERERTNTLIEKALRG